MIVVLVVWFLENYSISLWSNNQLSVIAPKATFLPLGEERLHNGPDGPGVPQTGY